MADNRRADVPRDVDGAAPADDGRARAAALRWWSFGLLFALGFCTGAWNWRCFSYVGRGAVRDGGFELRLDRRLAFPRSELSDPRIVARFRVVRGGEVVAEAFADLDEDSDLVRFRGPAGRTAEVVWDDHGVRIRGYDDRRPGAEVELRFR